MKYEITKGSEKDFEGAPEWARLVVEHCEYKYNTWFYESDKVGGQWKQCKGQLRGVVERDGIGNWLNIIAERRPITELVWDGEGLPPVGVECEHCPGGTTQTEWEVVKVLAINERPGGVFTDFWLQREDGSSYIIGNPYRFRPIPSPEDVARDEGVKEIMETFRVDGELVPDYVAFAMWDAGYRKLEGK